MLPKLRSLILLKNSDKNKTRKRGENFRQIAGKDSNGLNVTNFITSFEKKTTEWISTGEYSHIKTHLYAEREVYFGRSRTKLTAHQFRTQFFMNDLLNQLKKSSMKMIKMYDWCYISCHSLNCVCLSPDT